MKKATAILLLLCLLTQCNYQKYRYSFFEGNWVLLNYLDTVQKYRSVAKANHMPMQEIFLKRYTDTAYFLTDGWETSAYAFQHKTSNQIQLQHYPKPFPQQGHQPLPVFINEYAYYLSYDLDSVRHVFVKPDSLLIDEYGGAPFPTATQRVINSLVLGGIYRLAGSNVPVQFYTHGQISGWDLFDAYQTCIGGDCRTFYEGDVVYLSKNNQGDYYTWEWNNNLLTLYHLTKITAPDEKPVYKKHKSIVTLAKLK